MTLAGFSHSGIAGSTVVCTSPTLIAAYHALHRLLEPRHPPYALSNLSEILFLIQETAGNRSSEAYEKLELPFFVCVQKTTYGNTLVKERRMKHPLR